MTWRSAISFEFHAQNVARREPIPCLLAGVGRALCASFQLVALGTLFALAAPVLLAGTVTGRIDLKDSKDAAVRKKMDYSGVVVWLEPVNAQALPASPTHAKIVQKDKTFTPHVLAVRTGTAVDFPNFDPIFHNAFSNYDGQLFDVGLYPPGTSRTVRFSRPGVVRVFCNIHASMSAVIVVVNTAYFDTTRKDGAFEIPAVAPGDYQVHIFHERAMPATLNSISRRITVTTEPLALGPLSISESGYLPIPHKNKYGHEYPAGDPDDHGVYPATHK
jgi:plastocyanin